MAILRATEKKPDSACWMLESGGGLQDVASSFVHITPSQSVQHSRGLHWYGAKLRKIDAFPRCLKTGRQRFTTHGLCLENPRSGCVVRVGSEGREKLQQKLRPNRTGRMQIMLRC